MQSFFELLGLAPAFPLNEKALETAYFAAQRACHPDRLIGKSEAERIAAIQQSQLVNDAYETLKNPLTRAEHLLELQGFHAFAEDVKASPELLMEIMELREQIYDAAGEGAALAALVEDLKTRAKSTTAALAQSFAEADYAGATHDVQRLHYLMKSLEEAHIYIYRLKAADE